MVGDTFISMICPTFIILECELTIGSIVLVNLGTGIATVQYNPSRLTLSLIRYCNRLTEHHRLMTVVHTHRDTQRACGGGGVSGM